MLTSHNALMDFGGASRFITLAKFNLSTISVDFLDFLQFTDNDAMIYVNADRMIWWENERHLQYRQTFSNTVEVYQTMHGGDTVRIFHFQL